ncbi:hypothetical protein [Nonomuraea sp. KM88]|uniref:hypothetical protein n=1 Tax=Nonomuraea sp. KM88 TaxID=3457427 RepID=UPI003FCC51A3
MIRQTLTAALVAGFLLAGTGAASAEAKSIPKGFLLTEARARGPLPPEAVNEEWWKISDSLSRRLVLNPCATKGKPRDGRVAMRTITVLTSAPSTGAEQLLIYGSTKSAQAAFRKLLADAKRCPRTGFRYSTKSVRIGSEAMYVGKYHFTNGKREADPALRWVVGRRGKALFLYTHDDVHQWKWLASQAKKMAKKVCGIRGVCG